MNLRLHTASSRLFHSPVAASADAPRSSRSRVAACLAFFITVFVCMAAAAALVSNDMPLMVVGL